MPHGEVEDTASDIFSVFDQEVLHIRRAWELAQLFDGSHPKAPLDWSALCDIAPTFYQYAQAGLIRFVVLGLARLADKDKRTVTLKAVWKETDCDGAHGDKAMRMALKIIGSRVFRKARDRELAHLNLATATGAEATEPLYLYPPPPGECPSKEENQTISDAVKRVAVFNEHVKAARQGETLEVGGRPRVDPADVAPCLAEMRLLADRLNRGS